jgi:peptide/nickel transport system substrate-binding protein
MGALGGSDTRRDRDIARHRFALLLTVALVAVSGCTSGQQGANRSSTGADQAQTGQSRGPTTLRLVTRFEIQSLAAKFDEPGGGAGPYAKRPFNAGLAVIDAKTQSQPVLAESLPRLNSESWQVSPDGRMQTTYQLRSGATWHDGTPLTAQDFVFAWRVYRAPTLTFLKRPQDLMELVTAPDPRTVVITWSVPFAEAGSLTSEDFDPLPSHILSDSFQAITPEGAGAEGFLNQPFWSTAYVGAGPYRLERRELGAFIEGMAFPGYVLGRPKIDRVIVRAMGDENTVLSNLLAGEIDFAPVLTLRVEHAAVLKQDWVPSGKGSYLVGPQFYVINMHQFRPDIQTEPALLDVRVRKAMAYAVDKQALSDGLFEGEVPMPVTLAMRSASYFDEVTRISTNYAYNPRQAEQLLREAGLSKDGDGLFAYPGGRRFRPEFLVRAGSQFERGQAIMVDTWHQVGLDVQSAVLPNVTVTEKVRQTFPNVVGRTSNPEDFFLWATSEIGSEENRWSGQNRAGWSNEEFDRLYNTYRRSIERSETDRLAVQMFKLLNDELPGYATYESPALLAFANGLRGPVFLSQGPPSGTPMWDIHEWTWTK